MRTILLASLILLSALPSIGQKVGDIEFFKNATGVWSGKGEAAVAVAEGQEKKKMSVVDKWKGQLVSDGKVFLQDGRVDLGNDGGFGYRWMYRYEDKRLIAHYADSTNQGGICEVKVSADKKSITLSPLTTEKKASKTGLFTTVTLKNGAYIYDAELRDKTGKVNVKTHVSCERAKPE